MAQPGLTGSHGLASRLADVSAVAATPFAGDRVDLAGVAGNARFLADAGIRVIVCGGNTGEFYALSAEELRAIVEATVAAVPSDTLVVSGAGQYAVADPVALTRLVAAAPELAWVCGLAETWAAFFWQAGARGFTSGLVNVAPRLSLGLRDALRSGADAEALRLWQQIVPFEQLRARHRDANNVAVVKAATDLVGLAGGPPRPPLSPLSAQDAAELERILIDRGLL